VRKRRIFNLQSPQARRVGLEPFAQGHAQAVSQKAHQNVRLNARWDMVTDGTQLQVAFERLESRLDFGQLHVAFPERRGLVARAKTPQQIVTVALLGGLKLVFELAKMRRVKAGTWSSSTNFYR
jgi:hypothetical protein